MVLSLWGAIVTFKPDLQSHNALRSDYAVKIVTKNEPLPASLLKHFYPLKIVDLSVIWTQIVGVQGEHADHLTTTMAQVSLNYFDVYLRAIEWWQSVLSLPYLVKYYPLFWIEYSNSATIFDVTNALIIGFGVSP